eukprot:5667630-Pyramimonas_sp.AAC.1
MITEIFGWGKEELRDFLSLAPAVSASVNDEQSKAPFKPAQRIQSRLPGLPAAVLGENRFPGEPRNLAAGSEDG